MACLPVGRTSEYWGHAVCTVLAYLGGTVSRQAVLAGLGGWLPPRVVDNHELAQHIDTSDEWIRNRTGIGARRVLDSDTATVDMAVAAGRQALRSASMDPTDDARTVDTVVLATATPDHQCPASAPQVASELGLGT